MTDALRVSEIFYSLQGEGARAGEPSVFVRLQGCSAKHACHAGGVRCDTEFESGKAMSVADVIAWAKENAEDCRWIVWTGGEPCDQLTDAHAAQVKTAGYMQAIETSGLKRPPVGVDWVTVSPKVAEHVMAKAFEGYHTSEDGEFHVDELKYVRHEGQPIPVPELRAIFHYVQPHAEGASVNVANLQHCMRLCRENPASRLSLQMHKLWRVL